MKCLNVHFKCCMCVCVHHELTVYIHLFYGDKVLFTRNIKWCKMRYYLAAEHNTLYFPLVTKNCSSYSLLHSALLRSVRTLPNSILGVFISLNHCEFSEIFNLPICCIQLCRNQSYNTKPNRKIWTFSNLKTDNAFSYTRVPLQSVVGLVHWQRSSAVCVVSGLSLNDDEVSSARLRCYGVLGIFFNL